MSVDVLMAKANCLGVDPDVFDVNWLPAAWEALAICSRCDVREECLAYVDPSRNYYDGVVGGIVWRGGKRVRLDGRVQNVRNPENIGAMGIAPESLAAIDRVMRAVKEEA